MDGQYDARWAGVADLAVKQHGVVALWQLLRRGMSRGWIEHKLRTGRLHPVHRGVYAVGYPAITALGRTTAAVLRCGPDGTLSHWSAAVVWGLLHSNRALIDVVAPSLRRGPSGIQLHRQRLARDERTRREGIPITTVPRTLLDLAAVANERQLRRAVNNAVRAGWLNRRVIDDLIKRHPRRRGITAFRAVTAALSPQTRRTRSDLEDLFLRVCRKHRLPTPISNAEIEGFEVDFHFTGTTLVIELDSYEYHRTPYELDQDHRRDAHLRDQGYEVLRVSEMWLDSDPLDLAETIGKALRRCALARA